MPLLTPFDLKEVSMFDKIHVKLRALEILHERTTPGEWTRGMTTHHTKSNGTNVAEFKHSDDAAFCEFAHNDMPEILAYIRHLQANQR